MDEVGSMPTSSIKSSELYTAGYAVAGTTWAGTALTNFRPLPLADCPVDSRAVACRHGLVRDDRPRTDGLGRDNNSLCERAG